MTKRLWKGVDEGTLQPDGSAITVDSDTLEEKGLVRLVAWRDTDESIAVTITTAASQQIAWVLNESSPTSLDACEPWTHSDAALDAARLAAMVEALQDPRATSKGHKRTIAACRMLADEVMRLRREAEGRAGK